MTYDRTNAFDVSSTRVPVGNIRTLPDNDMRRQTEIPWVHGG